MKTVLPLLVVIFSILGIADASYLTWEKLSGTIPPCHPIFKCNEVLSSPWASIGPIPISAFGLVFYATFLGLGIWLFVGPEKQQRLIVNIIRVWGIFGALFSSYLVILMGVVIKAWCLYCLLSAINCFILLVLSLSISIYFRKENSHED